ncbi:MAG: alpha/beta hydrolase [Akkermansia sp.]
MNKILRLICPVMLGFMSVQGATPNQAMTPIKNDTRVFPVNPDVRVGEVRFTNRFGIELVGHLYLPTDFDAGKPRAAVALSGPFGAVKEQVSGLYAQELARRGFVTLAFDPSFTGESGGAARSVASADINTEDFSAAVDFLSLLPGVDPERIGIVGICGWGGFAINAAAIDTRIKATVTSTMYDMHRLSANGYNDAGDSAEARQKKKEELNAIRTADARRGSTTCVPTFPDVLPEDAPQFVKEYFAYYRTPRGSHPRSIHSAGGWARSSELSLINTPILAYAGEIRTPVLLVHGEKAHSRYFSEKAYSLLPAEHRELRIVPGANHTDLYYRMDKIPFDRIESFLREHLK